MKDKISQTLEDENYLPVYIPHFDLHSPNPVDALFSYAELCCGRQPSSISNIEDAIFNRFEKVIKKVYVSTLKICISFFFLYIIRWD